MRFKKYIFIVLLSIEIIILAYAFVCGTHGLIAIFNLQKETYTYEESIKSIQKNIDMLTHEIEKFELYPFYKEKIAREHLQYFKPGEHVYLLNTEH